MLRLVRNIFLTNTANAPHKVAFIGVDDDNGSSSVCVNVGRALAGLTGKPVCLVDGNIDSARLSQMFAGEKMVSFSDKLGTACGQCVQVSGNLWLAAPAISATVVARCYLMTNSWTCWLN